MPKKPSKIVFDTCLVMERNVEGKHAMSEVKVQKAC
jgi:hypothetical protein